MKRLIQIFTFTFLITVAASAKAEYYIVYPGTAYYTSANTCNSCCNPCGGYYQEASYYRETVYYPAPVVVYMRYVSPHKHNYYRGSEEMAEYAWIPYP